jgi:hypothetical protein
MTANQAGDSRSACEVNRIVGQQQEPAESSLCSLLWEQVESPFFRQRWMSKKIPKHLLWNFFLQRFFCLSCKKI